MIAFHEDPRINKAYLVLENAGEKTLSQLVEDARGNPGLNQIQKGLRDDEIKSIMAQLIQATEYLHSINICHRDLKPDNIMITPVTSETPQAGAAWQPFRVKLIDFNVAVKVESSDGKITGGTGLKEWSAPETRKQAHNDFKIDSWTLGCVMYFMCTG